MISAEIRLILVIFGRGWWLPCVFLEVCREWGGGGGRSGWSERAGDPWKPPLHFGILSELRDHLLQ